MHVKKSIIGAAMFAAAALTLAACGEAPPEEPTSTSDDSTGSSEDEASSDVYACLVSDQGGFEDQSFNQAGYEGLQRAEAELGVRINAVASETDADFAPNIDTMIQEGCTLIIGAGFLLEDAIQTAAEANPDIQFALVDSAFTDPDFNVVEIDNAKPLLFNTVEAAFLGGYVAAAMSESGIVATYGGQPIPSVQIFMDGYAAGIEQYNTDNGTEVRLLGWDAQAQQGDFAGSFEDQSAGQNLTQTFLAQGADVILPVAGPVGLGTGAALDSNGSGSMIWVDSDGYLTTDFGSIIITSVMKQIGPAVFTAIEESVNGNYTNAPYVGTLEDGGVGLAPYYDFEGTIPQEVVQRVEELQQEIIDGERTVESVNSP
ncbi:MAG: BMP family protein [Beutenbergiaceae bacterium]